MCQIGTEDRTQGFPPEHQGCRSDGFPVPNLYPFLTWGSKDSFLLWMCSSASNSSPFFITLTSVSSNRH